MWSVAAECTLRCYSKVRARRKKHRGASAGASLLKDTSISSLQPLQGLISGPRGQQGARGHRIEPPQTPSASSGSERRGCSAQRQTQWQRAGGSEAAASSGSEQRQRAQSSRSVQNPRHHTIKHIIKKLGLYHVSRRAFRGASASLPEREQRLVLLRPGPFPTPDAGKASLHAGPIAGNFGRRARQRPSK